MDPATGSRDSGDIHTTGSDASLRHPGRMDHHRLRKYRGPETWAQVREAYIAGEPAPAVARRFDVGLSNLRRRARLEGWTRNRIAERLDLKPVRGASDGTRPAPSARAAPPTREPMPPWIDPEVAYECAMWRASWMVSQGRAAEAEALMKAADRLKQMHPKLSFEPPT